MLLVIPSIEIKDGRCARTIQGVGEFSYNDDPVEMAKLWRKENAKSLHVTDIDGSFGGRSVNFETIKQMVKSVDIPIELGGGLRTFDDVKKTLDVGVYRTVIGTMLLKNSDEARQTLNTFGPNKIVLGIDARNYRVTIKGREEDSGISQLSVALNAKALGFRRILYTDVVTEGTSRKPNFAAIKLLAEKTQLRITVSGGISGLDDLMILQEFEALGVDSVVIGRALYENKFSCQGLWRLCETGNYPYTAKV